jgi:hypothetical protein
MSPSNSKNLALVWPFVVTISIALSLWIGFVAQASSPNYLRLFINLLPMALLNALLVALVLRSKPGRVAWLVAILAFVGFASYFEMGCRVLLGFRFL